MKIISEIESRLNLDFEIEKYLISNANKLKINSQEIEKGDVFFALQVPLPVQNVLYITIRLIG